jgi:hypothetical protein
MKFAAALCCIFSYILLLILSTSAKSTALHRAAHNGRTAASQLLIAAKADLNATDVCALLCLKFVTNFVLHFVVEIRL